MKTGIQILIGVLCGFLGLLSIYFYFFRNDDIFMETIYIPSPGSAEHIYNTVNDTHLDVYVLEDYQLPSHYANHNVNISVAEHNYVKQAEHLHAHCTAITRMSHGSIIGGDGAICIVEPFKPGPDCLVYSFGINYDFSFEQAMEKNYQCTVRSFDPSMDKSILYMFPYVLPGGEKKMSELITFYKVGLGGRNEVQPTTGWVIRTLGTLLANHNATDKVIEVLKIDIEYSEWEALRTIFAEGSLQNVKQFVLEIHTPETLKYLPVVTVGNYIEMHDIIVDLERQGFRKYYTHLNPHCSNDFSRATQEKTNTCYEMSFFNKKYLNKS